MTKKTIVATVGSLLAVLLLSGSFMGLMTGADLEDYRRTIDRRIGDILGTLDQRMGEAIKAIPGAQYNQMIEHIHTPCEILKAAEKSNCIRRREIAQGFLASLGKVVIPSSGETYKVSLWVTATDGEPLSESLALDIFQVDLPNPDGADAYVVPQSLVTSRTFNPGLKAVHGELNRPVTTKELDAEINAAAREMFHAIVSKGVEPRMSKQLAFHGSGSMQSVGVLKAPDYFFGKQVCDYLPPRIRTAADQAAAKDCTSKYEAGVSRITEAVRRAVLAPFKAKPIKASTLRITKDWAPLAKGQHLLILMPATIWERMKGRVKLVAKIHRSDEIKIDSESVGSRVFVFPNSDIGTHKTQTVRSEPYGDMVWGVGRLTYTYAGNEELVDVFEKARREFSALRKELSSPETLKK